MKKQQNTLTGHYWFWVVLILVVGGLAYWLKLDMPGKANPDKDAVKQEISGIQLILNLDNGKTRIFEGPANDGTTVLSALYYASKSGNLDFRYYIEGGKVTVASIAKIFPATNKTWHFYLNGKLVNSAEIDRVLVKKGDTIEVKFE